MTPVLVTGCDEKVPRRVDAFVLARLTLSVREVTLHRDDRDVPWGISLQSAR
jgi:hypothetical protein